jgi:putative intracellular protease/amidase
MRLRFAILVASVSVFACSAADSSLRVALYVGSGSNAGSAGNFSEALAQLVARGVLASFDSLADADVGAKLTPSAFDVVVFPGGSGSGEFNAIGEAGQAAVRAFVAAGKGYYGTCAGGFLALTATCCSNSTHAALPGYCDGGVGCSNKTDALALIDYAAAEPWDRGHGMVSMIYDDNTVAMLKLDPAVYGGGRNTSVLYYQGPIADRAYPSKGYTSGATFTSEIHSGHPNLTTGQMIGTTALAYTTYGEGRVLISIPHPEETVPRLNDVVAAYVLYAGKAI